MYSADRLKELLEKDNNKILKEVLLKDEAIDKFKYLIMLKKQVDLEAYAMYVRILTQMDTEDVPLEILEDAYAGLEKKDVMAKEELERFEELPQMITIYRGTTSLENPPRISWSLKRQVAERFAIGYLYKATIDKDSIWAYYCSNNDEEEIITRVLNGYKLI